MKVGKRGIWYAILSTILLFSLLFAPSCSTETAENTEPAAGSTPGQTIELKYATFEPEGHYRVPIMNWFAQELDKRTAGKTQTTVFAGGALGGPFDITENIINGVADMGYAYMGLVPGHNPVYDVLEIPLFVPSGPGAVNSIAWDLYSRGYFDVEGTKIINFHPMEPVIMYTSNKKVTTVDDMKGLVLHIGAPHMSLCEKLGISGVELNHPDIYSSVEKGVVDGGLVGIALPKAMKMEGIIKYIITNNFVCGTAHPCLMNIDKWNSLPGDVQATILELGRQMDSKLVEAAYVEEQACYDYFRAAGVEVYSLDAAEWNKIVKIGESLPEEWAKEADANGAPGTEALNIVRQDLKALGFK